MYRAPRGDEKGRKARNATVRARCSREHLSTRREGAREGGGGGARLVRAHGGEKTRAPHPPRHAGGDTKEVWKGTIYPERTLSSRTQNRHYTRNHCTRGLSASVPSFTAKRQKYPRSTVLRFCILGGPDDAHDSFEMSEDMQNIEFGENCVACLRFFFTFVFMRCSLDIDSLIVFCRGMHTFLKLLTC